MARASRLVAARQLDATVRHAAGLAAERAGELALQASPVKGPDCRLTPAWSGAYEVELGEFAA
jgi:hypothetical protein